MEHPDVDSPDTGPEPGALRSWRSIVFAPIGDGQRRRRGSDGLRVVVAIAALVACVLVIRSNGRIDRAIVQVIHPAPLSISWLVTVVYDAGAFGLTALIVVLALVARRYEVARDIVMSIVISAVVTGILILALGSTGGRPAGIVIDGYHLRFPVLQIAAFMAVATAALPYLSRGFQRLIEVFVALVALAAAVGGHGLPVNVLGSLAIGWGATAVVHLVVGSPLGLPSIDEVLVLLEEVGIHPTGLQPTTGQVWGVATYVAEDDTGSQVAGRLGVSVYGRDAADAKVLTKLGRFLLYRDSGPSLTITRLQQVEHEAYLTLRAGQAGVTVPDIVEAGVAGASRDALLVSRAPVGRLLSQCNADDVGDGVLHDLYRQLLIMREARIVHGALGGGAVLVHPEAGSVTLMEFREAASHGSVDQLDRDLAGAMAATALVVGPERAARAAAACLSPDVLAGALRHLRKASLDSSVGRALRGSGKLLEEVRRQAAEAGSIEVPKLVEPRRVSWPTLIMVIGTMIGGWALIGVLIDVSQSFDTVIGADWLWVIVAFILSQSAFIASAVEDLGSVAGALPLARVIAVEVANCFSSLAGGTPAVFATRVRFFQQQGYDSTVALSSGAIVATASWIATAVLFLVSLPFAWGTIHIELTPESGGDSKLVWIILALVVAVGVVIGVIMAVPRVRALLSAKLVPRLHDMWGNLRVVARTPRKLVQLLGGSLANELLVAMALSVSLRAFDDHLRLPTLIVVITLAAIIGGVSPSPGGMGVVEAGMILGLTAAGVSEADATAAVFIQRLFTSYLPPIWGWFTLVWMRKREYL
jgi:uncharacterized membrane protein YbhN (UPF0104 family)